MTVDEIKTALSKAGLEVEDEARLPNNTGVQLRLKNGSIVNCFDTGTHSVQGRNQEVVNSALGNSAATVASAIPVAASHKVFVVYGHDPSARTELEAMLRDGV